MSEKGQSLQVICRRAGREVRIGPDCDRSCGAIKTRKVPRVCLKLHLASRQL